MKLAILAVFNTNSRCLIRIWRSLGQMGSKNRKRGLESVVAEVGKLCKITKIRESYKMGREWEGEVQTVAK